jgi:hypothetical protein
MKINGLFFFFQIVAMTVFGQASALVSEKDLFRAVNRDNVPVVNKFLSEGNDINGKYGRAETTLLNRAIQKRSKHVFDLLLAKGADLNKQSQGSTPLVNVIRKRNLTMLHRLLKNGADTDAILQGGNTALIYAAKRGRLNFVKALIEYGADTEIKNSNGYSALELSSMANHREVAGYLARISELRYFFANMHATRDGPHIEWVNDTLLRMFYFVTDTLKKYPVFRCDYFPMKTDFMFLKGFAGDTLQYTIERKKQPYPWKYENVGKILALGDIHGEYEAIKNYLISNMIIDQNLDWIWGDGHLVLLGDIFDRGDRVTETLWLIHQLDIKSRLEGGRVHLLLGNHEVMVMIDDVRYLSQKYRLFSQYFSHSYSSFYNRNTEMGKWLRKRNVAVKINGIVFSHAGMSPMIKEKKLTIERMNFLMQHFLAHDPQAPNMFATETNLLLGKSGPLWYRGYVYDFPDIPLITQDHVNQILDFLKAEKKVIAHSEMKRVSALFNDKVIAIDLPIIDQNSITEGLLIQNGHYYRLLQNGRKIPLFVESKD